MNVSYVNFDKTKPYSPKQIGDGLPNTSLKSNKPHLKLSNSSKNQPKHIPDIQGQQDIKHSSTKTKEVESDSSIVTEKTKSKRQSKVLEAEQKQPEANIRQAKKHKKDS